MAEPRNMARITEAICAEPWLITRAGLEQIISVAHGAGDLDAVAMKRDASLDRASRAGIRNGIATINVIGPVFRYSNLFSDMSGASSLQLTARDFQTALDDTSVKGILLNVDSPGGQAAGVAEFTAAIRAAKKPVWAYVDDLGASAAYWIAAAADRVVLSRTALVGSIGVVSTYRSRADDKTETIEIVSSQSPKKRMDIKTDAGRAEVQRIVDQLASVFVADIAAYRNVSEDKVVADFGEGSIVFAPDAVTAGMADAIGNYEGVLAELAGSASNPAQRRFSMSNEGKGQVTVSTTDDLRTALAAGYTAEQISIADSTAAIATARAEGRAEGMTAGKSESVEASVATAVTAERERIAKVQGMARAGFETELKAAIDGGDSPEKFAMTLITTAQDRGITLDAINKDAPKAAPHSKPGEVVSKQGGLDYKSIYERRRNTASK